MKLKMKKRKLILLSGAGAVVTIIAVVFQLLQNTSGQAVNPAPEVHQLASVAKFTGIYSYIGGYIAVRELYFLVGLLAILVAGNVIITFFQLPSMFLPVYHNQRRSLGSIEFKMGRSNALNELINLLEESLDKWS